MRNLFWLLILIFSPKNFIKIATEDVIKKEFESNKQLSEQYSDKNLPEKRWLEFYKQMEESSLKVRESIIRSFVSIVLVIFFAIVFAKLVKFLHPVIFPQFINFLRLFSVCLIFWSVWGRLGWEIQTFKGQTLPEVINTNWSKSLYLAGIFLAVMSYFL